MTLRLGCGSGGAPDRVAPARDLAERGALDFLCFEALAERTLALEHLARRSGTGPGYSAKLLRRIGGVLPGCVAAGTRILTNMGGAAPMAAGRAVMDHCRKAGLPRRVAVVTGDDVLDRITPDTELTDTGRTVGETGTPIAANAYIGHASLRRALDEDAEIVIAGRVADSSLFLAPIAHRFGIGEDDWTRLGRGALIGHLLECSTQVTGGYFADPPYKQVPGLDDLAYPLAEVAEDCSAVIAKLEGTGGCITPFTVKEQLLYEVHDPAAYLTPDVAADFSTTRIEEVGPDRVRVSGAGGGARPEQLKVLVGFDGGFLAEAEIGYAGPGAAGRARLAADMIRRRMVDRHGFDGPLRLDLIGIASLHAGTGMEASEEGADVRLRGALRSMDRADAELLCEEIEGLWMGGPAGGGGFRGRITGSVVTRTAWLPRDAVPTRVEWIA